MGLLERWGIRRAPEFHLGNHEKSVWLTSLEPESREFILDFVGFLAGAQSRLPDNAASRLGLIAVGSTTKPLSKESKPQDVDLKVINSAVRKGKRQKVAEFLRHEIAEYLKSRNLRYELSVSKDPTWTNDYSGSYCRFKVTKLVPPIDILVSGVPDYPLDERIVSDRERSASFVRLSG